MSKKSDHEKLERIEQEKQRRMARFSSTLLEYLKDFVQYYRQDVPSEGAFLVYQMGLQHLNEVELKAAFQESIQKCKFFPTVAEMLECLREWRERQPIPGTAVQYDSVQESIQDEEVWNREMASVFAGLQSKGDPLAGKRWTAEDGWLPWEESIRREIERDARKGTKPHFHVVAGRIALVAAREPGDE